MRQSFVYLVFNNMKLGPETNIESGVCFGAVKVIAPGGKKAEVVAYSDEVATDEVHPKIAEELNVSLEVVVTDHEGTNALVHWSWDGKNLHKEKVSEGITAWIGSGWQIIHEVTRRKPVR